MGFRSLLLALPLMAAGPVLAAGTAAPVVEDRSSLPQRPVAASSGSAGADSAVVVFEQLQQFQAQVEALTGRVEQLEHELAQLREQQKTQYVDVDRRLSALAAQPAAAAAVPPGLDPAPATPTNVADGGEQGLYDQAQGFVRERRLEDAIRAFTHQLRQFPRGELAPQAMYWLGELWLAAPTPDVPLAGRYFYRVYNEYPKHARAPAAMYRHGLVQCQLGETAKGRVTLNRVIVQHAGSADAKMAEAALREQCR